MIASPIQTATDVFGEEPLRTALARCDRELARLVPILGHLLSAPDQSLFSEEIVARVRGMMSDLAWQLLRAQAEAAGQASRAAFADSHGEALTTYLQGDAGLLSHCHALAIEWQLTSRLEADFALDPVLSPLMQQLIASTEQRIAEAAMTALAAQARYAQSQRRMELPLSELTADLFHAVVMAWKAWNGPGASDVLVRAEARLRNGFDESTARLALLARLVAGLPAAEEAPLHIERAGAGLFLTALSARSGQSRDEAVLATHASQAVRLSAMMRAAGASQECSDTVQLLLHPDARPARVGPLTPAQAREALGPASQRGHG